jgi:hypothetical protein
MSSVVGCPRGGGSPDNPSATEGETGKPGPSPAVADARWRSRITLVDPRVTFSIPSPARCPPSFRIAFVVAPASQTRVRRARVRDGCGTRVHTFPDALATSIAQTRSRICSCSSSSIS